MKKERLIIALIAIFSTITMALATPTLKNCGNSVVDTYCTNSGCRIDFGNSPAITNCEMDLDTPQVIGTDTACWTNYPQLMKWSLSNGNVINFIPYPPQSTSLNGLHAYVVCVNTKTVGR